MTKNDKLCYVYSGIASFLGALETLCLCIEFINSFDYGRHPYSGPFCIAGKAAALAGIIAVLVFSVINMTKLTSVKHIFLSIMVMLPEFCLSLLLLAVSYNITADIIHFLDP